jgi:hypothetical protein
VEAEVAIVNVLVKVGLPDCGLKDADAPEGRPETDKDTGSVEPETRLAVIVMESDPPRVTVNPPPALKEKSKGGV